MGCCRVSRSSTALREQALERASTEPGRETGLFDMQQNKCTGDVCTVRAVGCEAGTSPYGQGTFIV